MAGIKIYMCMFLLWSSHKLSSIYILLRFLITSFSDFNSVFIRPMLSYGRWSVSPRVDHQRGAEIPDGVCPPSWQVEDFSREQCERDWRCFCVERKFFQVWFSETV